MQHLAGSVVAALAVSIATYVMTGSFLVSFLAYVGTGTTVLLMVFFATWYDILSDGDDSDT